MRKNIFTTKMQCHSSNFERFPRQGLLLKVIINAYRKGFLFNTVIRSDVYLYASFP